MGVLSIEDARSHSETTGLDLVLIAPDTTPPVCKVVDYGQFKYEQRKKEKQSKKGSKVQVVKELKMSPKISDHDYQVRVNRGLEFLGKSYQLKISVKFKGREITRKEFGEKVIERFLEDVKDHGKATSAIMQGHRSIYVIVSPIKRS